jgi:hypothetical protein
MSHIIYCGVDFHARQQTICCLKTETGELTSHELKHDHKEALRQFYSKLGGPVIVGLEASGYTPWFEELLEELGHQVWSGMRPRFGGAPDGGKRTTGAMRN